MARSAKRRRRATLAGLCALALLLPGCDVGALGGYAVTLGSGWLLGALTAPRVTETVCFRNGIQVDCSELPDFTP